MIGHRRGQAPIIGSLLLVLVVSVLAGTVLLYGGSLGSGLADPARTSVDSELESGASLYESTASLRLSHEGGRAVSTDDLAVVVDGTRMADRPNLTLRYSDATFGVGEWILVEQTGETGLTGGEEVLLLQETGESAFRLGSFTVEGGGPGAGPSVFGFESSDVGEAPSDPWSSDRSGGVQSTLEVSNSAAASGEKSLHLSTSRTGGGQASTATASIDVNLTGVAEIRVDYYDQNDAQIRVGGTSRTGGERLALVYERGDTTFRLRTVTIPG